MPAAVPRKDIRTAFASGWHVLGYRTFASTIYVTVKFPSHRHANIATTMKYAHLAPGRLKASAVALEATVG